MTAAGAAGAAAVGAASASARAAPDGSVSNALDTNAVVGASQSSL